MTAMACAAAQNGEGFTAANAPVIAVAVQPIPVTLDFLAQYLRALRTSRLVKARYDPHSRTGTMELAGDADVASGARSPVTTWRCAGDRLVGGIGTPPRPFAGSSSSRSRPHG